MKKLSILVVLVAAAIAVPLSIGSSHREAPNISMDPSADNTDVYAFTPKSDPGSVAIVANWFPNQVPANGPNFFRFDDRARYYVNIDNTGDGKADLRYRYKFKTRTVNRNSFLFATPQVTSLTDPQLNVRQSYTIVKERYRKGRLLSARRVGKRFRVAPSNVGPKTMPNYQHLSRQAVRNLPGGGQVFAGQREDPFFVDLGATFDSINFRVPTGNSGAGKDDFSGLNTQSIVMKLPERLVTKNRKSVSSAKSRNAVVGVWSSTERPRLQVTNSSRGGKGGFRQVSRLGNPLVNEVVIPLGRKDEFNRTKPHQDARRFGRFVLNPELARVMNALYPGVVNAPEKNRDDIVTALLQGIPGLNRQVKGPNAPAVDTLKLNLGVAPAADPNRFGVLAGDNAGFPNGRRLTDDVVDIELRVIAGFLKGNKVPLGDGVDQNDAPFSDAFPYVAEPVSGFDSDPSNRREPPHAPTPGQP